MDALVTTPGSLPLCSLIAIEFQRQRRLLAPNMLNSHNGSFIGHVTLKNNIPIHMRSEPSDVIVAEISSYMNFCLSVTIKGPDR